MHLGLYWHSLVILFSVATSAFKISRAQLPSGLIGCQFNAQLCSYSEVCINDGVFGICQKVQEQWQDHYQFHLTPEQSNQLNALIHQLTTSGYFLSHDYTQCVLSRLLHSYRYGVQGRLYECDRYTFEQLSKYAFQPLESESSEEEKELDGLLKYNSLPSANEQQRVEPERPAEDIGMESKKTFERQLYELTQVDFNRKPPHELNNDIDNGYPSSFPHSSFSFSAFVTALVTAEQKRHFETPDVAEVNTQVIVDKRQMATYVPPYMIAVYVICGIFFIIVIAALAILIFCLVRKTVSEVDTPPPVVFCDYAKKKKSAEKRPWFDEPDQLNVDSSSLSVIWSYMEDHMKNKGRLQYEWEQLCVYKSERSSVIAALHPDNTCKNKYPDVVPYEHSRVHLIARNNIDNSGYINASTIADHDPQNPTYIVTQAPLPHTVADFWQMVWEHECVVIVNLTSLTENSLDVCYHYWPENTAQLYHIYEVRMVSEHAWCTDYCVRSFLLKNVQTSETRTITQFHFLSWPENGVPSSPKILLDFRRKVNKSFRSRLSPLIVHCSDGAGRSGTYCLIDMVITRISKGGAKEIDISATLERIRDQRPNMVRTKGQFEFAFMCVACEVSLCCQFAG